MKFFLDKLLDATILFSFDRSGYMRHLSMHEKEIFSPSKNVKALVTGATSGIGYALAFELAKLGVELHLICRSFKKGEETKKNLQKNFPKTKIHLHHIDMSSLKDVYNFSEQNFDIVIHNAGSMPLELTLTPTGDEYIFASHVLGPFILTKKLIETKSLQPQARIIFVSSGGMYLQKLDLSNLQFKKAKYNKYTAYANAKRAQVFLAELFAKNYPSFQFSAMHPGWVDTPGVSYSMPIFYRLMKKRLRTPIEGASTILWLALTKTHYPNGKFWFDQSIVSPYYLSIGKSDPSPLWDYCEKVYQKISIEHS